jgi:hypothetical protein
VHAATEIPLITPPIEELLKEFYKVKIADASISLSVNTLNCLIKHKIP